MKQRISNEQKQFVAKRADFRCEYCLLPDRDTLIRFHIEHIRSVKHGGSNELENLAYACPDCNYYKGTDLGTFLHDHENIIRFFNPRIDNWFDHFESIEGVLHSKTDIGTATIKIFQINQFDRIQIRKMFSTEEPFL